MSLEEDEKREEANSSENILKSHSSRKRTANSNTLHEKTRNRCGVLG